MKKHVKKGKGKEKTISPTSSKNKIFTVSYKEKWIHNRRFTSITVVSKTTPLTL